MRDHRLTQSQADLARLNREVDAFRGETARKIQEFRNRPKREDYPNRQQYRAAVARARKEA